MLNKAKNSTKTINNTFKIFTLNIATLHLMKKKTHLNKFKIICLKITSLYFICTMRLMKLVTGETCLFQSSLNKIVRLLVTDN